MYNSVHTSFDVMKEFLITGAELDGKYQIPMIPAYQFDLIPEDSIDFEESFSRKIKNHRKLNVSFYVDDCKFLLCQTIHFTMLKFVYEAYTVVYTGCIHFGHVGKDRLG